MPVEHHAVANQGHPSEDNVPRPPLANTRNSERALNFLICALVVLAAFAYMHHYMLRGWVSHDEGTLAGTAERVLHGELPHREFDDVYTGGLAYLNAAAFRIFGMNLASMRYMLMIFALAWTAAIYYCISRFLAPLAAGFSTLLAIAWGPANYFAAVPSWYNLFFATFGTAALLRLAESRQRRWILLAGVCGGISVLFKISGAYFVIAAGAWLLAGGPELGIDREKKDRSTLGIQIVPAICGVLLYELFLIRLALTKPELPYVLCFFLPAMLAGVALLICCFRYETPKYITCLKDAAIFAFGAALPLVVFLIPYLRSGTLGRLINGVFVEPMKRLVFAATLPPHMGLAWGAVVAVVLLAGLATRDSGFSTKITGAIVFVISFAFVIRAAYSAGAYEREWTAVFVSFPLLVVIGSWRAVVGKFETAIPSYRAKLVLVVLVAAMSALVQFPYSAPIYFCYVAALGVLAAAALVASLPSFARSNSALLALVVLIYAVWQVGPVFIHNLGWRNVRYEADYVLKVPRAGGIRIPAVEGQIYDRLGAAIHDHARGEYIFAGPDCPEIYFLTGRRNPTTTYYAFLSGHKEHDSEILQALSADNINLIVINSKPEFSPPLDPDLLLTLNTQFPEHEFVGPFDVRWRQ